MTARCESCGIEEAGLRAAVPVGGGGAWPDNTQIPQPIGGRREACGAWPDNEPTRRSKLAARMAEAGGTDTTVSQISHAIPPRLSQILKLDRWNCNVFRLR